MKQQKTALVLSAGGMFGAYQAGVYKAIHGLVDIDMVVGASVGVLNRWPIAAGCSPDELIEHWLDAGAAGKALKLFDSSPLRAAAEDLHARYTPRIPFGLVVFQLRGWATHLVQHPDITPSHLLAACSIPFVLPPVRIAGRRYIDGGVFAKLPVFAALAMGATRIIAVDVLPDFNPWRHDPAGPDVTLIKPSEKLGDVKDIFYWKRENIARWIDLGIRDAAQLVGKLECKELA